MESGLQHIVRIWVLKSSKQICHEIHHGLFYQQPVTLMNDSVGFGENSSSINDISHVLCVSCF